MSERIDRIDSDRIDGDGDAAPAPEIVVEAMTTGEPRVDAAVDRLGELAGAPVEDHVAILGDVHARLTSALADLAEGGEADGAP